MTRAHRASLSAFLLLAAFRAAAGNGLPDPWRWPAAGLLALLALWLPGRAFDRVAAPAERRPDMEERARTPPD